MDRRYLDCLSKRRAAAHSIRRHAGAMLHLDATYPGTVVPGILSANTRLPLEFAPRFVPDLIVDDIGVCGTLQFEGIPWFCTVPWRAVWAISRPFGNKYPRGLVWWGDVPYGLQVAPVKPMLYAAEPVP